MDFVPGVDRIDAVLETGQSLKSVALQVGEHLRLDFGLDDGTVYLATTTLADLHDVDVLT